MIASADFPRLTAHNNRVTSRADAAYNCIAWSAGDDQHWWQPGRYWPIQNPPLDYGIGVLEQAFATLGFEDSENGELELGFEKIALFGSGMFYTHAARQLPTGKWTSKLGKAEDIEHHAPDDVAGGIYGEIVQFMRRAMSPSSFQPRVKP